MASGKNFRQEKRMPTFYVMVTAVVFVAFCLIGAWILSSPSESRVAKETEIASVDVKEKSKTKVPSDSSEAFEDSAGDLTLENEEKAEETSQSQSDLNESAELDTEQRDEETSQKKPSKKPSKNKQKEEKEIEESKSEVLDSDFGLNEGDAAGKEMKDIELEENGGDAAGKEMKEMKDIELEENGGSQSEFLFKKKETAGNWDSQASESKEEKEKVELEEKQTSDDEILEDETDSDETIKNTKMSKKSTETKVSHIKQKQGIEWTLCEFDGAVDYIPCLDNMKAIKALHSTKHYEHRERHCPVPAPTCLAPLPEGYRTPIRWPQSRNEVWYSNVPHPGLVSYKKDQNWVKRTKDRLIFPGGGTQFKHGALHYIDYIEQIFPDIAWGKHSRVVLDVGCGVASFGGYIFDREVLTMSFAPKDEHEAQVQFALERGIPAISSVMGTQRLVFPSNVYDIVHCARCRVPWHIEGGKLLLELNRVLRPGGYFVWSATPVYWKGEEDVQIWKDMAALTAAMCWKLVAKSVDTSTGIGAAIFQKPTTNFCYENRKKKFPPMCDEDDKPDAAWYAPMTACIHRIPSDEDARGTEWPQEWPLRLTAAPTWLKSQKGLYGKPAVADFQTDTEHWQRVVQKSYLRGLGIEWKDVRNVMDMRAVYGGFAAALTSQPVWVMNVVQSDAADTLPVIFDRGMFGIYHDWCESFSSYPRTYDLLHADHLFSRLKKRCNLDSVIVEMDRLLRPGGWAIVRDKADVMSEVQALLESLHWDIRMTFSKATEGLVAVQKTKWRP